MRVLTLYANEWFSFNINAIGVPNVCTAPWNLQNIKDLKMTEWSVETCSPIISSNKCCADVNNWLIIWFITQKSITNWQLNPILIYIPFLIFTVSSILCDVSSSKPRVCCFFLKMYFSIILPSIESQDLSWLKFFQPEFHIYLFHFVCDVLNFFAISDVLI